MQLKDNAHSLVCRPTPCSNVLLSADTMYRGNFWPLRKSKNECPVVVFAVAAVVAASVPVDIVVVVAASVPVNIAVVVIVVAVFAVDIAAVVVNIVTAAASVCVDDASKLLLRSPFILFLLPLLLLLLLLQLLFLLTLLLLLLSPPLLLLLLLNLQSFDFETENFADILISNLERILICQGSDLNFSSRSAIKVENQNSQMTIK